MRRKSRLRAALMVAAMVATAVFATAPAASAAPVWALARPVEFDPALLFSVPSGSAGRVSCWAPGDCTVAGQIKDASGGNQAFTQTSTDGVWSAPRLTTFGTVPLNSPRYAGSQGLSCSRDGSCTMSGQFAPPGGGVEAFTQTLLDGVWSDARPTTFATADFRRASPSENLMSISCSSAGNCTASGYTIPASSTGVEALTQTMTNGVWSHGRLASFTAGVQNPLPYAFLQSVSCVAPGECVAVGNFADSASGFQGFTQTQTNGTWSDARPSTFTAGTQNATPDTRLVSVSCSTIGNCTAVGSFKDAAGGTQAFTQELTNGSWSTARPATFAAGVSNSTSDAKFYSISCASTGNCTAVGRFKDSAGGFQAIAATSTNGIWGDAGPVGFAPGLQNATPDAMLAAVSCASPGNCTAVGRFKDAAGGVQAFAATSTNGVWAYGQPAAFAAGVQNSTPAGILNSVSCTSADDCTASGSFKDAAGGVHGFTMSAFGSTPPTTTPIDPEPTGTTVDPGEVLPPVFAG